MNTLFEVQPNFPVGFSYVPRFLSPGEEEQLLRVISSMELHPFQFQGFEAKRKVASFGFDYLFGNGGLVKGKKIPPEFEWLVEKTAEHLQLKREDLGELLVTEYPPGSMINWHRDAPPFDLIAGISLGSDCTFRLRPHKEEKRRKVISFAVERRSLYVIKDHARTEWQHSIAPVKSTRHSITLRTLRKQVND